MPVYYFVQPDLPEHIKEITLSYTFFRDESAQGLAMAEAAQRSDDENESGSNEE